MHTRIINTFMNTPAYEMITLIDSQLKVYNDFDAAYDEGYDKGYRTALINMLEYIALHFAADLMRWESIHGYKPLVRYSE
ncbi:MAG: hypothetical protein WKF87_06560 [Chryseolinea sp.]